MLVNTSLFAQLFSLLSLFFIISLSIIVLKNGRRLVNWLFFLLTIILDLWIFGSFMMLSSGSDAEIIFWDRFVYAAIVFWPAFQYHFSLAVTYTNRKRRYLLGLAYSFSFIFLFLSQINAFADGVFHYTWGAHTIAGWLHNIFVLGFAFFTLFFFSNLFEKIKNDGSKLERSRTWYYVAGFLVLDVIGGTAFLPAYSIPFYPVFLSTPLIFSLIITHAIVYFSLMDIRLIIRRYLVYFFSLISVIMPFYIGISYVYLFHIEYLSFAFLFFFLTGVTVFPKIKRYYYRFANKYLFASLYDFNELIYNLNNRLRASLNIKEIFSSTIEILSQAFHSKAIAVLYYEEKTKKWTVLYDTGFNFQTVVDFNYKDVDNLLADRKAFDTARSKSDPSKEEKKIFEYLDKINAEVMLPIDIQKNKLGSLMIFGPKESKEIYNNRDLEILESIAAEIGISLENALLYKEATEFNKKLKNEIDKATKKLKEQNESLKQLDQAKTEFIGIASHQLRTPLTGIRWFTELLLKNKENNLNNKQIGFLNQLSASNQRMARLVNDLLDVSHLETGQKFEIMPSNFNVNGIIEEVLKENIYLISIKNLTVVNKIPSSLKISADREKIKQVLQNLFSNATKYSRNNSQITLSFTKNNKGDIVFCINDQGVGIPKGQQKKIFTKFFRASNASSQHGDGTGLGLYIAKEIIKAHGGDVWFDSIPDKETNFYVSLPKLSLPNKKSANIKNRINKK